MAALEKVIYLSDVRLSFPNLVEPQVTKSPETGKERTSYNCDLIMSQDHPGFAQFYKLYGEMASEKWKENAATVMGMIHADRKLRCYGIGTEKVNKKTFKPYAGYENMVFLTAGSKNPPQMIQLDGTAIDPMNTMAYQQLARKLYGGCRVNAAVKPWLQTNQFGNGIRLDLTAIQFLRDDAPFGEGHVDAAPLFGAVQGAAPAAPAPAMPGMPFPAAGTPAAPGLPPFLSR